MAHTGPVHDIRQARSAEWLRSRGICEEFHLAGTVPEFFTDAGNAFLYRGAYLEDLDGFAPLAGLADSFSLGEAWEAPETLVRIRNISTAWQTWLASAADERASLVGTSIVYSRLCLAIADAAHARDKTFADDWRVAAIDITAGYDKDMEYARSLGIALLYDEGDTLSLLAWLIECFSDIDRVCSWACPPLPLILLKRSMDLTDSPAPSPAASPPSGGFVATSSPSPRARSSALASPAPAGSSVVLGPRFVWTCRAANCGLSCRQSPYARRAGLAATIGAATVGAAKVSAATVGVATVGAATVGVATVGAATVGVATVGAATRRGNGQRGTGRRGECRRGHAAHRACWPHWRLRLRPVT